MKIRDLAVGDTVKMMRLVAVEASVRQTKTKKDYLAVTFTDGTDRISGNMWDYNANATPMPIPGTVYTVSGAVGEYLGTKQLTPTEILEPVDQDKTEFMAVATECAEEIYASILARLSKIENQTIRDIACWIYETYKKQLLLSTAAKDIHHVGAGGTLLHTNEVIEYADCLADIASKSVCVNRDLIVAGAALHDIGKMYTYAGGMPVYELTVPGVLLDHIILGIGIVDSACGYAESEGVDIDYEAITYLKHIIAAHHGKLEYGSPVLPACVEALIVNRADGLSADVNVLSKAFEKAGDNPMTERLYSINNRPFFTDVAVSKAVKV